MSFRPGLLPNLLRAAKPSATFSRAFHRPSQAHSQVLTMARQRPAFRLSQFLFPLALGTTYMTYNSLSHPAKCDSFLSGVTGPTPEVGGGNPPTSELSGYQLGFGAVCGVCTGVFVKKGLKAIAFLLGGCFILMQVSRCLRMRANPRAGRRFAPAERCCLSARLYVRSSAQDSPSGSGIVRREIA